MHGDADHDGVSPVDELVDLRVEVVPNVLHGTHPLLHARVAEITGSDPLPYGLEANRAVVEQLLDHCVAQKILSRRATVDELFAHV